MGDIAPADLQPRPISLLAVLDRLAELMEMREGRWELQLVFYDGNCVEARPSSKPGKLTRDQLDRITLPIGAVS